MKIGDVVTVTAFGLVYHGYIHNIYDKYIEVHHSPFDIDVEDKGSIYAGNGIDKIPTAYGYADEHIHVHGDSPASDVFKAVIHTHIADYIKIKRYFLLTKSFMSLDKNVEADVACSYDIIAPYLYDSDTIIQDFRRAFNILLEDGYNEADLISLYRLSEEECKMLSTKDYNFWREGDPVALKTKDLTVDGYISYKDNGIIKVRYNPYEVVGKTIARSSEIVLISDEIAEMSLLQMRDYNLYVKDIEDGRKQYEQAFHFIGILNRLKETYALYKAPNNVEDAIMHKIPSYTSYGNLAVYLKETLIQYSNTVNKDAILIAIDFGMSPDEIDEILR